MLFLLGLVAFVIEVAILWVNATTPLTSEMDARSRPIAVFINAFLLFWISCALVQIYELMIRG